MAVPRGNTPRITIRVQGAAAVQRKLKDAERRIDAARARNAGGIREVNDAAETARSHVGRQALYLVRDSKGMGSAG